MAHQQSAIVEYSGDQPPQARLSAQQVDAVHNHLSALGQSAKDRALFPHLPADEAAQAADEHRAIRDSVLFGSGTITRQAFYELGMPSLTDAVKRTSATHSPELDNLTRNPGIARIIEAIDRHETEMGERPDVVSISHEFRAQCGIAWGTKIDGVPVHNGAMGYDGPGITTVSNLGIGRLGERSMHHAAELTPLATLIPPEQNYGYAQPLRQCAGCAVNLNATTAYRHSGEDVCGTCYDRRNLSVAAEKSPPGSHVATWLHRTEKQLAAEADAAARQRRHDDAWKRDALIPPDGANPEAWTRAVMGMIEAGRRDPDFAHPARIAALRADVLAGRKKRGGGHLANALATYHELSASKPSPAFTRRCDRVATPWDAYDVD